MLLCNIYLTASTTASPKNHENPTKSKNLPDLAL